MPMAGSAVPQVVPSSVLVAALSSVKALLRKFLLLALGHFVRLFCGSPGIGSLLKSQLMCVTLMALASEHTDS